MKKAQKLGLMASIIGMTTAIFGKRKTESAYKEEKKTNAGRYMLGGGVVWNPQAIFIPRRTRLKGWQKDNKSWGRKG